MYSVHTRLPTQWSLLNPFERVISYCYHVYIVRARGPHVKMSLLRVACCTVSKQCALRKHNTASVTNLTHGCEYIVSCFIMGCSWTSNNSCDDFMCKCHMWEIMANSNKIGARVIQWTNLQYLLWCYTYDLWKVTFYTVLYNNMWFGSVSRGTIIFFVGTNEHSYTLRFCL